MSGGTGTVTRRCPPNGPELGSGAGTAFHRATELPLGCLPTAPACARAHADAVLHEWGLAHLADDAVMIVSELTTNAYDASVIWPNKPPIALRLIADDTRLLIEVWDHSPVDPAPVWCAPMILETDPFGCLPVRRPMLAPGRTLPHI